MLIFCAGVYAVTPEWSSMQKVNPPKAKHYLSVTSEDGFITVYYDVLVHKSAPDVERYAKVYEHVDQHFRSLSRQESKVSIYLHSYKKFERRMNRYWPEGAESMRQGWAIYHAFTYEAKDERVIIVEAYEPLDDSTMIHELLHHYMNRLARDGSLNQEDLVAEYTHHVQAIFRTTLEEEF
jgi:hypothetical protein